MTINESADISAQAIVAKSAQIWHLAQVREGAVIGENVVVGRGAYVGEGVQVGQDSKIQNYALVYEPATLGRGVFIGPAAVLTNDPYPRAVNPDGTIKRANDWVPVGVIVEDGASIGASAVCIAPLRIGSWAMVAAGAVVTRDVSDYELVGGIPARHLGWVGPAGHRLVQDENGWHCPETNTRFKQHEGKLIIQDHDELHL